MNSYLMKPWTWGPETLAPAKPACICAEHHAAGTVEFCFPCKTWTDCCAPCGTDAPEPEPERRRPMPVYACRECGLPETCNCDPFAPYREVA